MKRLIFSILVLSIFISCKEEEDNKSVVGTWTIKSYRYKVVDAGKEMTNQLSLEVGKITFRKDGTGEVALQVPVTNLPNNGMLEWVEHPETFNIIVDYKDGRLPRTYVPSYRGNYIALTRKNRDFVFEKFMDVTIEILLERQ